MTTKERFLNPISKALGRKGPPTETVPPFVWRHSMHRNVMRDWTQDRLAGVFMENSRRAGIEIAETTLKELKVTIRKAVEACGPGPVVLAGQSLLRDLRTADALGAGREVRTWNTGDSEESSIRFAEKASVGIAVAEMALAESGTVLLFGDGGCGRSVTLLPESVIYIVPESRIRPRLTQGMQWLERYADDMPSSAHFVSGPSATSDIELVRVVGVHGPLRVFHIVVHDI